MLILASVQSLNTILATKEDTRSCHVIKKNRGRRSGDQRPAACRAPRPLAEVIPADSSQRRADAAARSLRLEIKRREKGNAAARCEAEGRGPRSRPQRRAAGPRTERAYGASGPAGGAAAARTRSPCRSSRACTKSCSSRRHSRPQPLPGAPARGRRREVLQAPARGRRRELRRAPTHVAPRGGHRR